MPDLYDDEDELLKLLDAGGAAPPSQIDPNELAALLEDAVAGSSGGPSMSIGEVQMGSAGSRLPAKGDPNALREFLKSDSRYKPWYDEFTKNYGGEPEINDPDYDYHSAVSNGVVPAPYKDASGKTTYHWASATPDGSMLKSENHPTAWMEYFGRATGDKDPQDVGVHNRDEAIEYLKKTGADPQYIEHLKKLTNQAPTPSADPDDDALSALIESPKETASAVMSESPQGRQQPFGVQDQRQDLAGQASRVAELYSQLEPEQQGGPGSHEQELQQSWAGNDSEIQSAMRTAAVLRALTGDDAGYGDRAKYLIEREKDHAGRLSSARAADAANAEKNRRVDQATAEMLVLAGVSPEAAVKARMGDPIVQLVRSTGGLGVKLRGQDTQTLNKNVGETGDVWQTLTEEQGKNERAELAADTQVKTAQIRKRGAKGGGGVAGGPDPSLLSAFLQRNENVPPATADAFVAGTLDPSDPNFAKLSSALTIFKGMTGKKQDQLLGGTLGREGGNADKAAVSAEVKQADPVQRTKIKRELAAYNVALSAAIRGWNSLPPNIKALVAKTGLEGATAQLRQAGLSPDEQAKFSPIIALINDNIKKTAGAAVSNSEWARKSAEIGLSGAFSPFNSPSVLTGWLKRAGEAYKADVAAIDSEYPGLFGGAQ